MADKPMSATAPKAPPVAPIKTPPVATDAKPAQQPNAEAPKVAPKKPDNGVPNIPAIPNAASSVLKGANNSVSGFGADIRGHMDALPYTLGMKPTRNSVVRLGNLVGSLPFQTTYEIKQQEWLKALKGPQTPDDILDIDPNSINYGQLITK